MDGGGHGEVPAARLYMCSTSKVFPGTDAQGERASGGCLAQAGRLTAGVPSVQGRRRVATCLFSEQALRAGPLRIECASQHIYPLGHSANFPLIPVRPE